MDLAGIQETGGEAVMSASRIQEALAAADGEGIERSIHIPSDGAFINKFFAFAGPGILACIAYLDPGNFVADLDLGSVAGYRLTWALLYASIISFSFQLLAARVGVVTGYGLSHLCRLAFPRWLSVTLWVVVELAIISADIQAVIGSAIGLVLLFHVPLWVGCLITALDTFFVLLVFSMGVRLLEAMFLGLIGLMAVCYVVQFVASGPDLLALGEGLLIPRMSSEGDIELVAAMLGATVMTHNLFLHSHLVQTRDIDRSSETKLNEALLFFSLEFGVSMFVAFFVNVAIVVVFAARFYPSEAIGLEQAGQALEQQLGDYAGTLWGLGILAAGQAATMTGTYTGQFVMEGFLDIHIDPLRRMLFTRAIALVPAMLVSTIFSQQDLNGLDSFVNIMQAFILPFAIFPMIRFLSSTQLMGNKALSSTTATLWGLVGVLVISTNLVTFIGAIAGLSFSAEEVVLVCVGLVAGAVYLGLLYKVATTPLADVPSQTHQERASLIADSSPRTNRKAQ